MSETDEANEKSYDAGLYEIRVEGLLEDRWAATFEGLTLTPEGEGHTLLAGMVADQATLHGLLRRVRDLGMPLISVTRISADRAGE